MWSSIQNRGVMAAGAPGPSSRAFLGGRGSQLERWASTRRPYLDNFKVVLITAILPAKLRVELSEADTVAAKRAGS